MCDQGVETEGCLTVSRRQGRLVGARFQKGLRATLGTQGLSASHTPPRDVLSSATEGGSQSQPCRAQAEGGPRSLPCGVKAECAQTSAQGGEAPTVQASRHRPWGPVLSHMATLIQHLTEEKQPQEEKWVPHMGQVTKAGAQIPERTCGLGLGYLSSHSEKTLSLQLRGRQF